MASLRIEFIRISHNGAGVGPNNVIHSVVSSSTAATSATAGTSPVSPSDATAVRLTAIGGVVLVNPKAVASETAGIRLADGQTEVLAITANGVVSYVNGV